jgi:hypothetical protein
MLQPITEEVVKKELTAKNTSDIKKEMEKYKHLDHTEVIPKVMEAMAKNDIFLTNDEYFDIFVELKNEKYPDPVVKMETLNEEIIK